MAEPFCWKIPEGLSTEEAACVPVPFGTADDCLFEFGRLAAGETALIHAGASGVGIAADPIGQAGRAPGCWPRPRGPRSWNGWWSSGSTRGSTTPTTDFVEEVRRLTDGHGADVVVDSVGGSTLQGSIRCLAYRGRCVTVGDAGRQGTEQMDISTLRPNNQSLTGYFLGAELFLSDRPHAMIARHLDDIAAGRLRVVIDRRFPLADAAAAHAYIESRQAFGRVLLVP